MERERGFTLIEILVGAAIAFFVMWGLVAFAARSAAWTQASNQRLNASANAGRLLERLSSEAASAWAVYVPSTDVLGANNADGHEVDFFSEDGAHRIYRWAYRFDATSKTLTRYALGANGPLAGDALGDIDAFSASAQSVRALGSPSSPAYDPLFATASAPDVPFSFAAVPNALGGNRLVAITLVASGVDRNVVLASEDAPTAFTVVVNYTPSPSPAVTPTVTPLTTY